MPVQCTVYTVQSVLSSGSNEPRTKTGFTAHPAIMLTCFFVLSLKWGLYTLPINGLWETRHLDISMRSLKSAGPRALPCGFPCVWTLGRHLELHVRSVRSLCQTDCRIGLASESQNKDAKTFTDRSMLLELCTLYNEASDFNVADCTISTSVLHISPRIWAVIASDCILAPSQLSSYAPTVSQLLFGNRTNSITLLLPPWRRKGARCLDKFSMPPIKST